MVPDLEQLITEKFALLNHQADEWKLEETPQEIIEQQLATILAQAFLAVHEDFWPKLKRKLSLGLHPDKATNNKFLAYFTDKNLPMQILGKVYDAPKEIKQEPISSAKDRHMAMVSHRPIAKLFTVAQVILEFTIMNLLGPLLLSVWGTWGGFYALNKFISFSINFFTNGEYQKQLEQYDQNTIDSLKLRKKYFTFKKNMSILESYFTQDKQTIENRASMSVEEYEKKYFEMEAKGLLKRRLRALKSDVEKSRKIYNTELISQNSQLLLKANLEKAIEKLEKKIADDFASPSLATQLTQPDEATNIIQSDKEYYANSEQLALQKRQLVKVTAAILRSESQLKDAEKKFLDLHREYCALLSASEEEKNRLLLKDVDKNMVFLKDITSLGLRGFGGYKVMAKVLYQTVITSFSTQPLILSLLNRLILGIILLLFLIAQTCIEASCTFVIFIVKISNLIALFSIIFIPELVGNLPYFVLVGFKSLQENSIVKSIQNAVALTGSMFNKLRSVWQDMGSIFMSTDKGTSNISIYSAIQVFEEQSNNVSSYLTMLAILPPQAQEISEKVENNLVSEQLGQEPKITVFAQSQIEEEVGSMGSNPIDFFATQNKNQ